jgi:ATP-dependent Lon protease
VALTLITSAEDEYQERYLEQKLKELQASLAEHKIKFHYKFDPNIHDRRIDLDNGWCIYPGRGLDIYQKPETKYGLSDIDQTKRKCRETDIIFRENK